MEKTGRKVVDITGGDPVTFGFVNQPLSRALVEAAEQGWHMYPSGTGWEDRLKVAIAEFENQYRRGKYSSDDIIVGPGAAGVFEILHCALLDIGDEVVSLDPSHYLTGPVSDWSYYGAKVVSARTAEEKDWEPDIDNLRDNITEKTKWIAIVNPNNPTGAVYSERTLKTIIDIAGEHDIAVVSDEIYGLITFGQIEARSTSSLAEDVPVITISGMSKFFMRTGWRVGYMCLHDPEEKMCEAAEAISKVSRTYSRRKAIPTPIMAAAARIYEEKSIEAGKKMVSELEKRKAITMKCLDEIPGLSYTEPKGAFYIFPRVQAIGRIWKTDVDFLAELLREQEVLFRPGSIFGQHGHGHFRSLLLPTEDMIEEIYGRLSTFLRNKT